MRNRRSTNLRVTETFQMKMKKTWKSAAANSETERELGKRKRKRDTKVLGFALYLKFTKLPAKIPSNSR